MTAWLRAELRRSEERMARLTLQVLIAAIKRILVTHAHQHDTFKRDVALAVGLDGRDKLDENTILARIQRVPGGKGDYCY